MRTFWIRVVVSKDHGIIALVDGIQALGTLRVRNFIFYSEISPRQSWATLRWY